MQTISGFFQHFMRETFIRAVRNLAVIVGLTAVASLLVPADVLACASCGCTLSSDWENLQFSYTPGLKLDLRYDYLNQNQLRSGTEAISPQTASQMMSNGDMQEVEKYTKNNYLTLGIDYSRSHDWGVNIQVPYINREHSTLGTGSDGFSPADGAYDSHTRNLGDIKIIGRYQGFTEKHNIGVLLGFKLATGSYTETGTSTDPTAPGPVPIDRGLQPGTGTTDVIFGAYYNNAINRYLGYFAQAQYQVALYSTANYRPGNSLNVSLGLRYVGLDIIVPQLQLNFREIDRDTGTSADIVSTGGTLLYISPGLVAAVTDRVSMYSFVQVPIYQDVNGVQLAPHYIVTAGVRYAF